MKSKGQSSSIGTPGSELEIDAALVYGLLKDQHPELMRLPIHPVDTGWDNAIFRLGDRLSVRLPRRQAAAALIERVPIFLCKPLLVQ